MKTKEIQKPGTAQLNVEIPDDLKRAIKATAASDGVTLQEWVAAALTDAVQPNSERKVELAADQILTDAENAVSAQRRGVRAPGTGKGGRQGRRARQRREFERSSSGVK